MGNIDYKYLVHFMNNTEWSKKNFIRKFSEEELNYLIEKGYIRISKKQEDGDIVYRITEKGKKRCFE